LPKEKNRGVVDKMWLHTVQLICHVPQSFVDIVLLQMLAAIGETFDPTLTEGGDNSPESSLITGVIVSTRPQFYRLSIWTRLAPNPAEEDILRARIEGIGRHFKTSVLGFAESQKLGGPLATEVEYLSHKDSEKKGKGKKIIV
jgi:translation initiation factor 4E